MTRRLAACLALAACAGLGCRNTADGAREDARQAAREAEQAAREAKRDLDRAARDAKRAADEAGQEARAAMREAQTAVREAGRDARQAAAEVNAAKQLVDVRAALAVSKEISSASDIDVSADESGRTVILAGTVATAAEKAAAGRIARASADGLRVQNRLTVTPAR